MNEDLYDYIDAELKSTNTMNDIKLKLFLMAINGSDDKSDDALNINRKLLIYVLSHYDSSNHEINSMISKNIISKDIGFYSSHIILFGDVYFPKNYNKNIIFVRSFLDCMHVKKSYIFENYIDAVYKIIDDKIKFKNLLIEYSAKRCANISFYMICDKFDLNFFSAFLAQDLIIYDKEKNANDKLDLTLENIQSILNLQYNSVQQKYIIAHILNNYLSKENYDDGHNLCYKISALLKSTMIELSENVIKNFVEKIINGTDEITQTNIISYITAIKNIDLMKLFIESKNIKIKEHFIYTLISSNGDNNDYGDILSDYKFTSEHLILACQYNKLHLIQQILNSKIIPEKKHMEKLLVNIREPKIISNCISILCEFGYKLTYDEILTITMNKIILPKKISQFEFVPDKTFYSYCNLTFMPKYNENMYNDKLWIERLSQLRLKTEHLRNIMKIIKDKKIKLDFITVQNLSKQPATKTKDELMAILNADVA
jgi:hypothetical protein